MSLKPDTWIRQMSTLPRRVLKEHSGPVKNCVGKLYHGTDEEFEEEKKSLEILGLDLADHRDLTQEEKDNFKPLISPFVDMKTSHLANGKKVPSFGLSSYGYDLRLGRDFKLFTKPSPKYLFHAREIDICNVDPGIVTNVLDADQVVIPPYGFALGVSMERICMPSDCLVICMAKSTVSRAGLMAIVTPLEPGWEGYVTLEMFNMTTSPMRLTAGMGIMQTIYMQSEEACEADYASMGGKYQNQASTPVMPI